MFGLFKPPRLYFCVVRNLSTVVIAGPPVRHGGFVHLDTIDIEDASCLGANWPVQGSRADPLKGVKRPFKEVNRGVRSF